MRSSCRDTQLISSGTSGVCLFTCSCPSSALMPTSSKCLVVVVVVSRSGLVSIFNLPVHLDGRAGCSLDPGTRTMGPNLRVASLLTRPFVGWLSVST